MNNDKPFTKTHTAPACKLPKSERPATHNGRSINWGLRVTFEDYELIQAAARAENRSMASFVVTAARDRARSLEKRGAAEA